MGSSITMLRLLSRESPCKDPHLTPKIPTMKKKSLVRFVAQESTPVVLNSRDVKTESALKWPRIGKCVPLYPDERLVSVFYAYLKADFFMIGS